MKKDKTTTGLAAGNNELTVHVGETQTTLRDHHNQVVNARIIKGPQGTLVFTLESTDHPYRVFCETINEGVAIMTKEGTILHCNKHLAEMVSTPIDHIIGASLYHFIAIQDRKAMKTTIQASGKTGFRGEFLLKTGGKSTLPIHLSASPVMIDSENYCVVITDLSEQKRLQKSLEAEILVRKETEKALGRFNKDLEQRVIERTAELEIANERLQAELHQRRQVEEALRHANELADIAQHAARAGFWDWDIATGHIEWSPQLFDLFGLDPNNTTASFESWETILHPEDKEKAAALIDRAVKEHTPLVSDYRVIRPDGQVRWISALGECAYDDTGTPLRMAGICRDITESKQLENTQSFLMQCGWFGEDFFQSLARYLAETLQMDYVCIDRLEGDCLSARTVAVYFDGVFEDNVSYTLKDTPCGDVVGKKICSFPSQVRHLFPKDEVLQEMLAESYVGTTLWSSRGQPIGLIAIIGRKPLENSRLAESILKVASVRASGELERRQAEEALVRKEKTLTEAQRIANIGSWEMNLPSGDLLFSDQMYRIFGVERGTFEPTYDTFIAMVHPDDRQQTDSIIRDSFLREGQYSVEYRVVTPQGEIRVIHAQAEVILEHSDEPRQGRIIGTALDITERKQMEDRLARLASFPEFNPNPIFESDLSGNIQYLNPAAQANFPDLKTAGPSHPLLNNLGSILDRCLKGENSIVQEVKIGQSWYQQAINYVEEYQRVRFYTREISERKKAEEKELQAYKALEQRVEERTTELRQQAELLDLAYDAIIVRNIDGRITFWNSGAEITYGWTKEEAHGKIIHDLLHTKYPCPLDQIIEFTLHEGHWEGELTHSDKAGQPIVVLSRWVVRQGKAGESAEIMEINRDISGRKMDEEILRQANLYNRSLIEASLDPLVTIDPKGMISDVNRAAENITGCSREQLIGTDFTNYFSDPQKARSGYKQAFKEGLVRDYSLEIQHQDGHLTPVLYNASVYADESGKVIGVIAAARDITEKNRLERQLRHSQTMEVIGTLAGGIAHDLNNIVAGIIGLGEMVIEDLPRGDPNHRKLELILKGAFRGRDVIRQILAFSRKNEPEKKPVSMGLIINEAIPFIRASLPSTIEIRQNIFTQSDLIEGDKTQIHQVILNLCTNAAYAMRDRGGILEITLKDERFEANDPDLPLDLKSGSYLKLSVSDTGSGIGPEVIERIFVPFFTTKSIGEGTGLGLSVVHGIVKSHNGIIKVYSQSGQGSVFHVFLPKMVSKPAGESEEIAVPLGGDEHILVVDDEDILVEMVTQRLRRLGYQATGKLSSLEALEAFQNEPDSFNLVITDYTMPKMTGLELAEALLRIRPDLPIILCSGLNEPIPMEKVKTVGVKEFYVKPIDKDDFAGLVRRVLDRNKVQNQGESR